LLELHRSARGGAPLAAPAIGQHTDEILREYGYSAAEIGKLKQAKAVA